MRQNNTNREFYWNREARGGFGATPASRGARPGASRGEGPRMGARGGDRNINGDERGMGRGRMRLFDAGGVKLAVLKLLSEQPAYGYQLIKTMEEKLAGGYTPSAGAIYPTLSFLEEEGLIGSAVQQDRKIYSVTDAGKQHLELNKARVEAIFAQLAEAARGFARGRSPELKRAYANLHGAVTARVARGNATEEMIRKMVDAIDSAARTIDEL